MPAANAAECAREQQKFWKMHDQIFANYRALEDPDLEGYAKKAGLGLQRFKACFEQNKHKDRIENDQKIATSLGARGTPAFFINGRYLSGAQPYQNFAKLVDEELDKAKKSGVAAADYYRKVVEEQGAKTAD